MMPLNASRNLLSLIVVFVYSNLFLCIYFSDAESYSHVTTRPLPNLSTKQNLWISLSVWISFSNLGPPVQYQILYGNILRKENTFRFCDALHLKWNQWFWKGHETRDRYFCSYRDHIEPSEVCIPSICVVYSFLYAVGPDAFCDTQRSIFELQGYKTYYIAFS
jgi:hypothetical protein